MMHSVEKEVHPGSSKLYFFFGGIAAGLPVPPFEFYKSAKILDESKIFFRDFDQCWYQNGLTGICKNIDELAALIKKEVDQAKPEEVVFIGNSMGGFAAILFATLTGAGNAIVFAPQTFICPGLRLRHWDRRWPRQIANTYRKGVFKRKIWDLRPLLKNKLIERKIAIYVSQQDKLDYTHAMRLDDLPGVDVYSFDVGGHDIVKHLKEMGSLPGILSGGMATS